MELVRNVTISAIRKIINLFICNYASTAYLLHTNEQSIVKASRKDNCIRCSKSFPFISKQACRLSLKDIRTLSKIPSLLESLTFLTCF